MNQEFLDFVESKISTEGSVQLNDAINHFWKVSKPMMERVIGYLNASGKYIVVRGMATQNLTIERNPNYDTNQSVIQTNKSVRRTNRFMRDNAQRQISLTKASIIVAGASAIFAFGSIATTIIAAKMDNTPKEVQELRKQLQKQSQIQEQMSQSQKEINEAFQKAVKDSFYQKHH